MADTPFDTFLPIYLFEKIHNENKFHIFEPVMIVIITGRSIFLQNQNWKGKCVSSLLGIAFCHSVKRATILAVKFHSNERHLIWALISSLKNKTKWKWRSLWRNCTRQRWCSDFCPSNVTVWTLEKKRSTTLRRDALLFVSIVIMIIIIKFFSPPAPGIFLTVYLCLVFFLLTEKKKLFNSLPSARHRHLTAATAATYTDRQTDRSLLPFLFICNYVGRHQ